VAAELTDFYGFREGVIDTDDGRGSRPNCTRSYVESCHDERMASDAEQREIEQDFLNVQDLATSRQFTRWPVEMNPWRYRGALSAFQIFHRSIWGVALFDKATWFAM
jgi:hypothetical protein